MDEISGCVAGLGFLLLVPLSRLPRNKEKVMSKGRPVGLKPKYTIGVAYVMAYRQKKTIEQIAKFFGTNKNVVRTSLKRHGVLKETRSSKTIKKLQQQVLALNERIEQLKK